MEGSLTDQNGEVHTFRKLLSLGREPKDDSLKQLNVLDVSIDNSDTRISHKHCSIVFDDWRNAYLLLNHSKNGTFVNDMLVFDEPQPLHNDDKIQLNKRNSNSTFIFKSRSVYFPH